MMKSIQYDTAQATRACNWCDQLVTVDDDQVIIGHHNNPLPSPYNCWLQVFHAACYRTLRYHSSTCLDAFLATERNNDHSASL